MRLRTGIRILLLLGLAVCAAGCTRPNLLAVGRSYLYTAFLVELTEHFESSFVLINGATLSADDRLSPAIRDDDRFPEWAREQYDACIHWEDPYVLRMVDGPMRKGIVQAWILVSNDLSKHILEMSLISDETGERLAMIDQWDGPVESESDEADAE